MAQLGDDSLKIIYLNSALSWVEKVIALDQANWKDYYNAGVICYALSESQPTNKQHVLNAQQHLETANQLSPTKPVLSALEKVYTALNDETKLKETQTQLD